LAQCKTFPAPERNSDARSCTDAAQLNPLYVLYTRCVGRRQAQAPHARPGGGCRPPALVLGAPAASGGLVRGRTLARARGSSSCDGLLVYSQGVFRMVVLG
jgi:hypothetical protein